MLERVSRLALNLFGISGGNVRQEHISSDDREGHPKGHISDGHLRHTNGIRANTLESRSSGVDRRVARAGKSSQRKLPGGLGRAMRH